jgi:hypothetical protein
MKNPTLAQLQTAIDEADAEFRRISLERDRCDYLGKYHALGYALDAARAVYFTAVNDLTAVKARNTARAWPATQARRAAKVAAGRARIAARAA